MRPYTVSQNAGRIRLAFAGPFLIKIGISHEGLYNGEQMRSCWTYFSEKMWKWNSTSGLPRHVQIVCEPIPWSAQGDQQIEEKNRLIQNRVFAKEWTMVINELQEVSKRVTPKRGKRLLGHLWSSKLIFDSQSEPTVPPKWSQGPKKKTQTNYPKTAKDDPKGDPESEFTRDS